MHAALTESKVSVLNMGGSLPAITDRELSSFSISISCWCCCCFFILATLAKDVATMQEDLSSSSGRFNGVVRDCCWCCDEDAAAAVADEVSVLSPLQVFSWLFIVPSWPKALEHLEKMKSVNI